MQDELSALTHCLVDAIAPHTLVAQHGDKLYRLSEFRAAVEYWARHFQMQTAQRYALYCDEAYPFAVMLFALLHAGKEPWLPGNNRPGTAQELKQRGCVLLGEWQGEPSFDFGVRMQGGKATLKPLHPSETQLMIFTSGSTGQPKPIKKYWYQLAREVSALERLWGKRLGAAQILSTVSHQHIYGLLFRILWPLAAGRCFHSAIYFNPEILAKQIGDSSYCWIASPAHLKRLDQASPWPALSRLVAIFSSGGVLPEQAALQIQDNAGQTVLEVYGSSETGGIAWREGGQSWTLFPDMQITQAANHWQLQSPYLPEGEVFRLDDELSLDEDGRFKLYGRADRIVKIEEKRLSLTEMEQRLQSLSEVQEAFVLPVQKHRDIVAAVIVLNPAGKKQFDAQGRRAFIEHLQRALKIWFDPVVLPRKWLFTDTIPLTAQGKIRHELLSALVDPDTQKHPKVLGFKFTEDKVQLDIKIPEAHELLYFPDHFYGYPILPGVVQLAWVAYFGQLVFEHDINPSAFSHLEVVKFIKIISPGERLQLTLTSKPENGELSFVYSAQASISSSGRMMYKTAEFA